MNSLKLPQETSIISVTVIIISLLLLNAGNVSAKTTTAQWQSVQKHIMTRWAKDVSPEKVHPEYPRPQMARKQWLNLNGLWEYAIRPGNRQQPASFDAKILVPFPVESALSGVAKPVGEKNKLWYSRTFEIPDKWKNKSILLNFGAVDWETTVWINAQKIGAHRGGYDAFTFDITEALKNSGPQKIVISVWDPTDTAEQPRGKQVTTPGGIWYTAVTGIWQTVWLEPVAQAYIKSLKIVTDIDNELVHINAICENPGHGYTLTAKAKDGFFTKAKATSSLGQQLTLNIKKPKLWSPDSPFLYDLQVTLKDDRAKKVDTIKSYLGMRKIALGKDKDCITRLFLNNKSLFHYDPLDQGWWPDGLYTAPTDDALRYDIEVTKKLGFNMARKHVKIEPDRWYYWCDKLGLLVWQDMPSGDKFIQPDGPDIQRTPDSAEQFERELKAMIDNFRNHPSIVMWVLFNEGWGQFDTVRLTEWIKQYDPTRLVNNASGWADRKTGDVHDIHAYPGPAMPQTEPQRAVILGEFGGLGLPVKNHTWQKEKNWGYRTFENSEALTDAYINLIKKLQPMIEKGLAAADYTQTTDVEIEVNGLMTYNRAMVKMDAKRIATANQKIID